MPTLPSDLRVDRTTLLVWIAMLGTGGAAWVSSGTPAAGGLIVLGVMLATVSPPGALYATCAAIPLVFRPIDVGSLQLGLLEIGILLAVAGTMLRSAFDFAEQRRLPGLAWVDGIPAWILLLLLLLVGTLSILWMPFELHRAEALRTWRWVILEPLLLYLLARLAIDRAGTGPLTVAIVLPAGFVALAAIWQLGSSSSSFSVDNVHRSTATYLHPNNLALYLERAAMLAFVPALLLKARARWVFLGLAAVLLTGVAATFSRGAVLGLATGCAVVLLAHPVRNGWKMLGAGALGAIAAFALLAGSRFAGADSSGLIETRKQLWDGAIRMLRDYPVTGIGLDQFLWLNQTRYIDPVIWSERYTSHPHNLLLDAWLSLGIPGIALLAAFLGAGGWIVWQVRTGRRSLTVWQLGALGCLGAGVGHGLVDNGYFLADLSAMTWLAIALLNGRVPETDRLQRV